MIWIVGAKGMLGQEICHKLHEKKIEFLSSGSEVDVTDYEQLIKFSKKAESNIYNKRINFIVNCSAYTAVDNAEEESEKAFAVNQKGAENLARLARSLSATLIHFSTDYVFDGNHTYPISETEQKAPLGVYGLSKSLGEDLIEKTMTKYYIFRTSWLYGFYGKNFVYTMAKLMSSKDSISVVSDQKGCPTNCATIANVVYQILTLSPKKDPYPYGIYNISDEGETTWYDFAVEIQHLLNKYGMIKSEVECKISSCSTEDYPTKAKRPRYSVLDKSKLEKNMKVKIPSWKKSLESFIKSKEFDIR